jgi:hypothetical protein
VQFDMPFGVIDWSTVPTTTHDGDPGIATWRTVQAGSTRIRIVDYPPGFRADHWCLKGHVVHVLSGRFTTEHKDGSSHTLSEGMTYHVGDDVAAHQSFTDTGVRLFIVD